MKVYIVMKEDLYAGDMEGPIIWNVDCVFDSKENAQTYIDNSRDPQRYFIIEKDVFTHAIKIKY